MTKQVRGKCIGYQTVNGGVIFAVPIQEIKPESTVIASVWFRYTGSNEEKLVMGRMYALQVVIHGKPREYEAIAATESA
jgi:hypothetical protein